MIGLVKSALNMTIGNEFLKWNEPQEVLLDLEMKSNNRPLSYFENDEQLPVVNLNVNSLLLLISNLLPDLEPNCIEIGELRKRGKHLLKCREAKWCL